MQNSAAILPYIKFYFRIEAAVIFPDGKGKKLYA